MPLNTRIEREGETLKMDGGWTWFHLSAMLTAAFKEDSPDMEFNDDGETFGSLDPGYYVDFSIAPVYYLTGARVIERGCQTLREDHTFFGPNGTVLELMAGDVLIAYRSSK